MVQEKVWLCLTASCLRSWLNSQNLFQNHKASKHEEHIPCPQCGVMFATKYTHASHIGTTHGEFALETCSECDYSTRNASEMKKTL